MQFSTSPDFCHPPVGQRAVLESRDYCAVRKTQRLQRACDLMFVPAGLLALLPLFALNARILWRTLPAVLTGRGAF